MSTESTKPGSVGREDAQRRIDQTLVIIEQQRRCAERAVPMPAHLRDRFVKAREGKR